MSEKQSDIWKDDLLDRKQDADFLIDFPLGRIRERREKNQQHSYVLNLDARWGEGKTFFMERLKRELEEQGYLCAYINAWKSDHAEDPLIAVMAEVDAVIEPLLPRKGPLAATWNVIRKSGVRIAVTAAKGGAKTLIRKAIGSGLDEITTIIESSSSTADDAVSEVGDAVSGEVERLVDALSDRALGEFREQAHSIENFKRALGSFLSDLGSEGQPKVPLFILVDEMDRCRPLYAIALPERVKHLFDVNDVVFIVATDSAQLSHSIKAVYGESFESERYLRRFFDRSYHFPVQSAEDFVFSLFDIYRVNLKKLEAPGGDPRKFCTDGLLAFGASLRDAEQCFDILRTIMTVWPYLVSLELLYLWPLIIAFQNGKSDLFSMLASRQLSKKNSRVHF